MDSGWSYNNYPDRQFLTYAFEQLIIHLSTQLSDVEYERNGILKKDFSNIYKLQILHCIRVYHYPIGFI